MDTNHDIGYHGSRRMLLYQIENVPMNINEVVKRFFLDLFDTNVSY